MNEDLNIDKLVKMMEEMANAPREPLGKRQPGEKCSYEKVILPPSLYNEAKKQGKDMSNYIKQLPIPLS